MGNISPFEKVFKVKAVEYSTLKTKNPEKSEVVVNPKAEEDILELSTKPYACVEPNQTSIPESKQEIPLGNTENLLN